VNHFSHNGGLNHDELSKAAEKEGFAVAYDGMEIETP
jgi:phosphoribosyl 1,2-cyclic phosphate phosphodiesterase